MNFKQMLIETFFGKQIDIDNESRRKLVDTVLCCYCIKQHTMKCPNSAECYSTDNKPHFEKL